MSLHHFAGSVPPPPSTFRKRLSPLNVTHSRVLIGLYLCLDKTIQTQEFPAKSVLKFVLHVQSYYFMKETSNSFCVSIM